MPYREQDIVPITPEARLEGLTPAEAFRKAREMKLPIGIGYRSLDGVSQEPSAAVIFDADEEKILKRFELGQLDVDQGRQELLETSTLLRESVLERIHAIVSRIGDLQETGAGVPQGRKLEKLAQELEKGEDPWGPIFRRLITLNGDVLRVDDRFKSMVYESVMYEEPATPEHLELVKRNLNTRYDKLLAEAEEIASELPAPKAAP